jgi:DNA-binding SARP family transcriptional activator
MLTGDRNEQEIAKLVWPDAPADVALATLRQALSRLGRQAFLVR